ncbi:ABC transporter substrate-binding protein [Rhodoplanes elegans]|uniref:ABC transporter substrate-binding protein n=1 Tax=Rhodoplanes elegans TaxID=29408 RepID=A0A327KSY0_9BRAD|nr:tripartite tricarboxylate transporter substrate binding protein [Rhodoplanes elegans]MBK5962527.1 ABC transporter substrate-binding protein [Rhodoplanes elegans]RAI41106.1 ABC transporter substrate-binding protein [Rhodoplanes elegans]
MPRNSLVFAVAFAAALAMPGVAAAQSSPSGFPTRDITFIVPWNPGGSNDVMARQLQPLLKEQGIGLIIENIVGANGAIGLRRVAWSDPDGYTLGMGTSSTLAAIAQGKAQLRNDQFTHLVRVSTDPLLLEVPGKSQHQPLEAFLAHMKKNPGKVSIGTPGTYNVNHIFAAMTARAAGTTYVNVPYTGGSKVIADLLGGHLDAGVLKPSESIGQIQEGLVKPIAVFADTRLEQFPDVPTFKEKGHDIFPYGPVVQMAYVVGPANLPPAIRERITTAFRKAIQDPRFKTFAKENSFLVDDLTGDALAKEVDAVTASLREVGAQVFKDQP